MSRKIRPLMLALLLVATALNVAILLVNLSFPSRASVSNMDSHALAADADFKKAVQSIVEACSVNFDVAKIRC